MGLLTLRFDDADFGLRFCFDVLPWEVEFFRRSAEILCRLGVLPGSFNPITVAHLALAEAALNVVDEVVFVLPREFPHKAYTGASFAERVELLDMALAGQRRFSVAASEGGLFVEIAGECRAAYGADVRLSFLCGRDAAERIANWDYGRPEAFAEMLQQFDLLVAARSGEYFPPESLSSSFAPAGRQRGLRSRIGQRGAGAHCERRALAAPGAGGSGATGGRNLQTRSRSLIGDAALDFVQQFRFAVNAHADLQPIERQGRQQVVRAVA